MAFISLRPAAAAIALLCLCVSTAIAQYRVHTWESFETGDIPATLFRGHAADKTNLFAYNYATPGTPPAMTMGMANIENANFGVKFVLAKKKNHVSVVSPISLDRRTLGAVGKALYQADFYLPPEGEPMPTTALMAMVVEKGRSTYKFYRFGVLAGGKDVYFAFANDTPSPLLFKPEKIAPFKLARPGWHRFQMIMVGQEDIYCAIDGTPTKFSPIKEKTLSVLNAGLMVADDKGEGEVVADNLSIQWSFENVPLPDSPWTMTIAEADKPNTSLMDSGASVYWLNDAQRAWKLASAQKRPILTKFYAPKIGPYQYLKAITPNDEETRTLLNHFVLLDVDVNQLGGGTMGQKFGIVRLPTFMVLGPDGKEIGRLPVAANQTRWDSVKEFLAKAAAPPATPAAAETAENKDAAPQAKTDKEMASQP